MSRRSGGQCQREVPAPPPSKTATCPPKSNTPPEKLVLFLWSGFSLGHADMIRRALIGRRGSPSLQIHTLLRSEDSTSTCDIVLRGDCKCLRMNADDIRDKRFSGGKLDSCQTFCLLIKMTDARTGMVDQIQTLTQLTAIWSQCYYSK